MAVRLKWRAVALVLLTGTGIDISQARDSSTVSIRRDAYGVPHVFAKSTYGLFYGFGYALAEDQLYQLELLKRTARGRLSEVLGSGSLETDRAARSRYDIASLRRQFAALRPGDQDIFRGMAAGISARIASIRADRSAMPKGFGEAGFDPEAWSAIDVIAIYEHSMVLRFSDLNSELDNLALLNRLRTKLGPVQAGKLFNQLRPVDDPQSPTTIAGADAPRIPAPARAPLADIGDTLPNGLVSLDDASRFASTIADAGSVKPAEIPHASNAWLAGPGRTGDGSAILVNGPQMGDFSAAYIWAVGLHGAGFNVVGSGPIGSPWLIFGTNGRIGWGATAGLGDTTDIYQERLDPKDSHRYRYDGAWRMMTRRDEIIAVKGSAPVTVTVWSTVHGQVELFDAKANVAYARRRSWAGREVDSLVAWVRAMQATDYAEWRGQVSKVAISVNNYFVDAKGNIGYQFLGRFPTRAAGQDPRLPVVGDGSMEWLGTIAGTDNPHVLNPRSGMIANWNNRPQPGYPSSDFMPWSRVDRQNDLLAVLSREPRLDREPILGVVRKTSFVDINARYFALIVARTSAGGDAGAARKLLAGWDGATIDPIRRTATPQQILFEAFLASLLPALYADILPPAGTPQRASADRDFLYFDPVFPSLGVKGAIATLNDAESPLLRGRSADAVVQDALAAAWRDSIKRYGPDPTRWFRPASPHRFSINSYAGVPQTAAADALELPLFMNRGTENDRIIFKGGKVDYCDVTPPGQSSYVSSSGKRSPHYADQLSVYAGFTCKRQWLEPSDVIRNTKETYRLRPLR